MADTALERPPGTASGLERGEGGGVADPNRPTIVFLHGWTMDRTLFTDQCARLKPLFDCLSLDLPGHGASRGRRPLGVAAAADHVAAALGKLADRPVILVGWSLGALVAWNMMRRHTGLPLAGLVAVDMSPHVLDASGWQLGIRGFDERRNAKAMAAMTGNWPAYALRINAGMYARSDTGDHDLTLAVIRRNDSAAMLDIWADLTRADERDAVARLSCPMLVVHGAQSRLYRKETADWLVRHAPRASAVTFDASGHSPHLEEPRRFAETVRAFVLETVA